MNLRKDDNVLIGDQFYIVEWVDDQGDSGLIGLRDEDGKNVVLSTKECKIEKIQIKDV